MIVLYFLSTVFSTAIFLLVGCLGPRDSPPLYTVRMARNKKRFDNDERVKKYTDQLKKERQLEEAEAAKIPPLRPPEADKPKDASTKNLPSSRTTKSTKKRREDEELNNTVRCNLGPSARPAANPLRIITPVPKFPIFNQRTIMGAPTKDKTVVMNIVAPPKTLMFNIQTAMGAAPGRTVMPAPPKDNRTLAMNVQTAMRPVSVRHAPSIILKKPAAPSPAPAVPAAAAAEPKRAAEPNLKTALVADKTNLPFGVDGGQIKITLTNKGDIPLIVKTRCSDNQILGVVPVFTHIDPGVSVDVIATRLKAPAKKDKVVFEWLPDPIDDKDLAGYFRKFKIIENKIELQVIIT